MNQKVTSASTVAENQKCFEEEKSFICGKVRDFAMLKCDIADFFSSSGHTDSQFVCLMNETADSADEFYTRLLSIYGMLVEMEVEHE